MDKSKSSWPDFLRDYFNIIVDPEQIKFEDLRGSQVFIPKGLSLMQVARSFKERAECYEISPHINDQILSNLRISDKDYTQLVAIKFKDNKKDDLVFLSKEITLLEGLVFELKYLYDEGSFYPHERLVCAGTEGFGGTNPVIVIEDNKLVVEFCYL